MHLLVPSNPVDTSAPDEAYAEEVAELQALGWRVSLFSFEDFEQGHFKARPALPEGATVLYRGWMLTIENYARLTQAITARGAIPHTSPEQYRLCHYLPGWYDSCRAFTVPTVFAREDSDFPALLAPLPWRRYFVKDFVKSLTTVRGSVATSSQEIAEIVTLLRQYRGHIEGGICIREFMDLRPETEERYFVFKGTAHSRQGPVPEIVTTIASHVQSPYFCIDVVEKKEGELVVIELGDGQVSDKKNWPASRFAAALNTG